MTIAIARHRRRVERDLRAFAWHAVHVQMYGNPSAPAEGLLALLSDEKRGPRMPERYPLTFVSFD